MAKVDNTPEDVAAMLRDIEDIAAQLKTTRAEMLKEGPRVVPMDVSTAVGHIAWLKHWADKVSRAPTEARLRLDAERVRQDIAARLKKKKRA